MNARGPAEGDGSPPADHPLARVLAAADPLLGRADPPPPGHTRFTAVAPDRAFVLEAVLEAYLTHFGQPRAFARLDPDERLLAGDSLYALGLSRLAAAGDLEAVEELADLISLCARAQAEGRSELVEPLWEASAAALGGAGPGARNRFAALIGEVGAAHRGHQAS